MNFRSRIDAYYPSLSRSERKVADYILLNQSQAIYQPLNEVAKLANVGEATVVRFCNKLGYTGFQSLRLELAKNSPRRDIDVGDDYIDVITGNLRSAIEDTASLLSKEAVNDAIAAIQNATRVFSFGVGTSGLAAMDLQSKLMRYGKVVTAITDSHFQIMTASVLSSKDLVIAFTLGGYTKDIVDTLEVAKKCGAFTIVITNHALSPAAELADIKLLTAGKESPMDGGSLSGRVSQLYIIDVLCTGYAKDDEDLSRMMRARTSEVVLTKNIEHVRRV